MDIYRAVRLISITFTDTEINNIVLVYTIQAEKLVNQKIILLLTIHAYRQMV